MPVVKPITVSVGVYKNWMSGSFAGNNLSFLHVPSPEKLTRTCLPPPNMLTLVFLMHEPPHAVLVRSFTGSQNPGVSL